MNYEIWFMDERDNVVGEAELEALDLVHALSRIAARKVIIPENAVTISMQVKYDE